MHDTSDLVLEAVNNSIEAGADRISVLIKLDNGKVQARIEDDGSYELIGNPFGEGITTKGEGRGRGLYIINNHSHGDCRLTRGDGITVLEFTAEDDGSFDMLDEALLPILGLEASITVRIFKNDREIMIDRDFLEKKGAVPVKAKGIRRYRELLSCLEKGDIYG